MSQAHLTIPLLYLALLVGGVLVAADGPTPFPDPANEKAWPGTGPVRVHPWMKDNRAWFWSQREKARGAAVFVGDSLTGNWKGEQMQAAFPGLKIANRGIGGDVSRGLLFRFDEDVLTVKPKALVLLIGTNDLSAHAVPAGVVDNIAAIIAKAQAWNSALPIVLCTIPPRDAPKSPTRPGALADLNTRIAAFAKGKEHLELLDLFPLLSNADGSPKSECFETDRVHLSAAGYRVWGEALRPVFTRLGLH